MPIYSYYCKTCKHHLSLLKPYDEKDNVKCPKCGEKLKLKLSAPSIGDSCGSKKSGFS